ncbi:hypothetical protein ABTL25_19385, partial [Acinetobacter baumannii]
MVAAFRQEKAAVKALLDAGANANALDNDSFDALSIAATTAWRSGCCLGLPNSVMSAPAAKVRPAQPRTIAAIAGSESRL